MSKLMTIIFKEGNIKKIIDNVKKCNKSTLLNLAHKNNVDIESACDSSLACSTCHVILDENIYNKLSEPSEEELDMLELAPDLCDTSRLSCQLKLNEL